MGSKSDYLEALVLNNVLGGGANPTSASTFTALFTTTPDDTGGGVEVSGSNYSRVAKVNNSTTWPNATGTSPSTKQNGTIHTFPTPSGSWGTVVAFGIFDAATTGNLLYWGALSVNQSIASGNIVTFEVNAITITED